MVGRTGGSGVAPTPRALQRGQPFQPPPASAAAGMAGRVVSPVKAVRKPHTAAAALLDPIFMEEVVSPTKRTRGAGRKVATAVGRVGVGDPPSDVVTGTGPLSGAANGSGGGGLGGRGMHLGAADGAIAPSFGPELLTPVTTLPRADAQRATSLPVLLAKGA